MIIQKTLAGHPCHLARVGGDAAAPLPLVLLPVAAGEGGQVGQLAQKALEPVQAGSHHPFVLAGFEVEDWDRDLTPWPAPAIFKKQADFAGGGGTTLAAIKEALLPALAAETPLLAGPEHTAILGYSLAGLFSLWAFYQSGLFAACGCCSGSLWYPGWGEYMEKATAPARSRVYLSLGLREEQAKNPQMATVGSATRKAQQLLQRDENVKESTLCWHQGGHFDDVPGRLCQGLLWLVKNEV